MEPSFYNDNDDSSKLFNYSTHASTRVDSHLYDNVIIVMSFTAQEFHANYLEKNKHETQVPNAYSTNT